MILVILKWKDPKNCKMTPPTIKHGKVHVSYWENLQFTGAGTNRHLFAPYYQCFKILIGIHSMQAWRATTKYGVTKKKKKKKIKSKKSYLERT